MLFGVPPKAIYGRPLKRKTQDRVMCRRPAAERLRLKKALHDIRLGIIVCVEERRRRPRIPVGRFQRLPDRVMEWRFGDRVFTAVPDGGGAGGRFANRPLRAAHFAGDPVKAV
jgi:hypothetical protein